MQYTKALLNDKVSRFGEVFVVLESGEEYELHGTESFDFVSDGNPDHMTEVCVEGTRDGVTTIAEFPLDAIEHVHTHREV